MINQNPYESPKSPSPISCQKRKGSLLLRTGLGMIAGCVCIWAVSFCVTFYGMTKSFNAISESEKVSPEKLASDIGPTITFAASLNGTASIIGGLGIVLIILAVFGKLFSKKQITPLSIESKANG